MQALSLLAFHPSCRCINFHVAYSAVHLRSVKSRAQGGFHQKTFKRTFQQMAANCRLQTPALIPIINHPFIYSAHQETAGPWHVHLIPGKLQTSFSMVSYVHGNAHAGPEALPSSAASTKQPEAGAAGALAAAVSPSKAAPLAEEQKSGPAKGAGLNEADKADHAAPAPAVKAEPPTASRWACLKCLKRLYMLLCCLRMLQLIDNNPEHMVDIAQGQTSLVFLLMNPHDTTCVRSQLHFVRSSLLSSWMEF